MAAAEHVAASAASGHAVYLLYGHNVGVLAQYDVGGAGYVALIVVSHSVSDVVAHDFRLQRLLGSCRNGSGEHCGRRDKNPE